MNEVARISNLTGGDYAVLLVTLLGLVAIGYFSGKKEDTTQNFFLGNRKIPMWAACLSFVATEISAVTIISVPATVYRENWNYLQLFIGSFASRIFLAFIFIPAFYKFNVTTIYEYLKHRFGAETQYAATCFFFVTRLMGSGVRLTVAATAVSILVGWPLVPTIVLFAIIGILYIGWGGVKAIIWTNVWQTLTFVFGGVATLWYLSTQIDGGFFGILSTARQAGKMAVFDWGPSFSDPGFFKAILTNPNIWWLAILNGFVGSVAAYGTDHELMQRLLTLETREKSQKTTLATPLAGLFVLSLYLLIGCGLYVFYQQHPSALLPPKLDNIYPHFASFQMPGYLRGLILSVVVMASIDSPLGSLSASFVTDIYKPLIRKDESDRHYMMVARVMVVTFGIILGVLAYSFSFLENFLWWAFKIGGVTFGSLLGVFLLGLMTERKSNRANILGMILMAVINFTLLILTERKIFVVGWTWLILIGTFGTMAIGYVLGPLMDKKKMRKFWTLAFAGGVICLLSISAFAKADFGIDVLKKEKFNILQGANVALITNHTGVDKYGVSTVDILFKAPEVRLVCILSPEHGLQGTIAHGQAVEGSTDPIKGIPVHSLYGKSSRPTDEMLQGVNTIVFDIQDIGTRFYTYIATMGMALEEAAKRKIRFVVLDRPNPIRGDIVEGDLLDADIKRLTGYFSIPVRHGLTVGELARWMNITHNLGANLEVVPLKKWKRDQWFDQTEHEFIPPSPNIPNLMAALLYTGVGNFEATNISVGRGTPTPFELFGAPWLDGKALCAALRQKNLAGVAFEPIEYTPTDDLYKGELCRGVKVIVTNRNQVRPFDIFLAAFLYIHANEPEFKPEWEEVRVVTGTNRLQKAAEEGVSFDEFRLTYREAAEKFFNDTKSFHLYQ